MPPSDFYCLWRVPGFLDFNFHDLAHDVYENPFVAVPERHLHSHLWALSNMDKPGQNADGYPWDVAAETAEAILAFTLRQRCCLRFLQQHSHIPASARDYYLSKFGQFLDIALSYLYGGQPCETDPNCTWTGMVRPGLAGGNLGRSRQGRERLGGTTRGISLGGLRTRLPLARPPGNALPAVRLHPIRPG